MKSSQKIILLCILCLGISGGLRCGSSQNDSSSIPPPADSPQPGTDTSTTSPPPGETDTSAPSTPSPTAFNLPTLSGDLNQIVSDMVFIAKNSDDLILPTDAEKSKFRVSLNELLSGHLQSAFNGFQSLGLELIDLTHMNGDHFYLIREKADGALRGWGLYAIHPNPTRPLLIEAPHPVADLSTETEAADFFLQLKAKALLISGTHRCANTLASLCSGTTTVCTGSSSPYKISDAAHSAEQLFEVAHETLMNFDPSTKAVALHGFAQGAGEPHAYISDGTHKTFGSSHLSNQLTQKLIQLSGLADAAQSCNDGSAGSQLCGTEDLQGRYANGMASLACTTAAQNSTERFLHIEQSLDLRTPGGSIEPQILLQILSTL